MKRITSLSLAALVLLTIVLAACSCGSTVAACYFCGHEYEKTEMDSGILLDKTIYVCHDCSENLGNSEDTAEDDHGHDHDH